LDVQGSKLENNVGQDLLFLGGQIAPGFALQHRQVLDDTLSLSRLSRQTLSTGDEELGLLSETGDQIQEQRRRGRRR
jgi:hypothetical protein